MKSNKKPNLGDKGKLSLKEDMNFFEKNIDQIRNKYGETNYLAIFKKQVIDVDPDKDDITKRYKNQPVLVVRVKDYERKNREEKIK